MDIQVTKHLADDKQGKYQVAFEGEVSGMALTPANVKVIITASDESLLKNFPRMKTFTLKLDKGAQTPLP